MSIGIAIIGSGIFVKEQHLPAVLATSQLSLKAIYSRSLKSAKDVTESLDQKPAYYSDDTDKSYDDLLNDNDIKAVIIALPILVQPAFIKKALQAGKHILAEKPIAKDAATAQELLEWYHANIDTSKVTWGVAENFRFFKSYAYAAEQVQSLGRVLSFRVRLNTMVSGGKYFETEWRRTPGYQGGFLLDGGVHFIAGIRLMLGEEAAIVRASAYSSQLQKHLPPVDTIHAVLKCKTGVSGLFDVSFGTTASGGEWVVSCEKGSVHVDMGKVTTSGPGMKTEEKKFEDKSGVIFEVQAWAEGIVAGKQHERQIPEEALKDLDVLEAMLRSGEQDGMPVDVAKR